MARLSRHDQAHRLTVNRLGRVDSHYVSPFESKFGLTPYRKYIISRTEDMQYLTSYLRVTYLETFFLREYGMRCNSNFILIRLFVSKKILISVVYYKYTTSDELTLLI